MWSAEAIESGFVRTTVGTCGLTHRGWHMWKSLKTVGLLAAMSALLLVIGQQLGGATGLIIGLVIATVMNLGSWFFSDKMAIKMARAQQVDQASAPALHATVASLADRAGESMPRLFVSPSPQLNAFASGRNPKHAVVCVNQGLLEALTPEELEGVLSHELQHVYNRDILIGSVAAMIATAITFIARMGFWFGGNDRQNSNPFGALATLILAPIAAMLIQSAITRSREELADHTGAELTGNPLGLARALAKLERGNNDPNRLRAGGTPMETNASMAHLFIAAPFGGRLNPSRMFSTHPPIPERIRALGEQAREMGQLGPNESVFDHL